MDAAAANRRYDRLHEALPFHDGSFTDWAKEPSASHPYHFRDGVTVWVAPVDLAPDDDFLGSDGAAQDVPDDDGGDGEQGH